MGINRSKYQYDQNKVKPLGFSDRLHREDYPTPQWFRETVAVGVGTLTNQSLSITLNSIDTTDHRLHNLIKEHLPDKIAEEMKTEPINIPHTLENYQNNFVTFPLPNNHQWVYDDDYFAFLRVGGWNPLMLKKVVGNLPSKFPVTEELFRQAPGFENDTISSAIADGRLFIQDYELLTLLEDSSFPHPDFKFIYHPIGLFGLVKGDKLNYLKPIAIQGDQDYKRFKIYTPRDGDNWQKMKFAFNSADANYHQAVSHLGRTHFLMEPFVVATQRLPSKHHLKPLIMAHLEGTAFINEEALKLLVSPGQIVDRLMMGKVESIIKAASVSCQDPGFNHLMLRPFLENNGTYDSPLYYPYRDDAKLIWDAIHTWMAAYVDAHYQNDLAIQRDSALQKWGALLADVNGGNLKSFGENDKDGKINTKTYLVDVLTMIAFTGGAQHAAVNFAQREMMTFAPICPAAGYKEISDDKINTYAAFDMLPDIPEAGRQISTLATLGGIYYTKLGFYHESSLPSRTKKSAIALRQRLFQIENMIIQRNGGVPEMYRYNVLLPSKIPQSVNV
eukprot:gene10414-13990_t